MILSRRDESNGTRIFIKKFNFFRVRGDPIDPKDEKLIFQFLTNFYKFGYHSIRLNEIKSNITQFLSTFRGKLLIKKNLDFLV